MRRLIVALLFFLLPATAMATGNSISCAVWRKAAEDDLAQALARGGISKRWSWLEFDEEVDSRDQRLYGDVQTVKTTIVDGVGIVSIKHFSKWSTAEELRHAIIDLGTRGAQYFLIDLGGNPGGGAWSALASAYHFSSDPDAITIHLRYLNGQRLTLTQSHPLPKWELKNGTWPPLARVGTMGEFANLPVVIRITSSTASSAEVFAGVLHEWGLTVIGMPSFGKGTLQRYVHYGSPACGVAAILAFAEFRVGAQAVRVEGVGLIPDVLLETDDVHEVARTVRRLLTSPPSPEWGALY